jgi:5'-nucleotidase
VHSQRWHGHRGSRVLVVAAASLSAVTLAAGCSSSSSKGADSPAVATTSVGPDVTASPVPSATPTPSPTPTLKPLTVLVTNDDGVKAEGIDAVVQALRAEPGLTIKVVGPATNQSGKGGTTTPGGNVTYTNTKTISGYAAVAVNGTPADSANVAFDKLGIKPDVTISGTNAGQNLGPVVDLSGTVGAARVAARHGVPALAVSSGFADKIDYASGAKYAIKWLRELRPTLPLASTS